MNSTVIKYIVFFWTLGLQHSCISQTLDSTLQRKLEEVSKKGIRDNGVLKNFLNYMQFKQKRINKQNELAVRTTFQILPVFYKLKHYDSSLINLSQIASNHKALIEGLDTKDSLLISNFRTDLDIVKSKFDSILKSRLAAVAKQGELEKIRKKLSDFDQIIEANKQEIDRGITKRKNEIELMKSLRRTFIDTTCYDSTDVKHKIVIHKSYYLVKFSERLNNDTMLLGPIKFNDPAKILERLTIFAQYTDTPNKSIYEELIRSSFRILKVTFHDTMREVSFLQKIFGTPALYYELATHKREGDLSSLMPPYLGYFILLIFTINLFIAACYYDRYTKKQKPWKYNLPFLLTLILFNVLFVLLVFFYCFVELEIPSGPSLNGSYTSIGYLIFILFFGILLGAILMRYFGPSLMKKTTP